MPREADRVAELSSSTGTGAMTLAGATSGHQTWASAFGSSNTSVHYGIVHDGDGTWEVGIGTFLPGSNALQRDLVLASSSAGSKVSFASGDKVVYCQEPAEATERIQVRRSSDVGIEILPAASQSASMIRVQAAGGGDAFTVGPSGRIASEGGIALGSAIVTSPTDLSRHIALWGATYGFGVTSGALNYNAPSAAVHDFYLGSNIVARIGSGGIESALQHKQDGGYFRINAFSTASFGTGNARIYYDANSRTLNAASDNAGSIDLLTINAGTFKGTLSASDGSASNPSWSFSGDANTGAYSHAANVIGLSAAGVTAAEIGLNELHYRGERLLVGGSSYTGLSPGDVGVNIQGAGATTPGSISATASAAASVFLNRLASNGNIIEFYRQSGFVAGISVTVAAVTYNTTSDARRKVNARDFDSGAIIDSLQMREFDWIPEFGGGTAVGALVDAETAAAFPSAFSYDDEHDLWSADYSKLVPVLWREVSRLRQRVGELEAA